MEDMLYSEEARTRANTLQDHEENRWFCNGYEDGRNNIFCTDADSDFHDQCFYEEGRSLGLAEYYMSKPVITVNGLCIYGNTVLDQVSIGFGKREAYSFKTRDYESPKALREAIDQISNGWYQVDPMLFMITFGREKYQK